MNSLSCPCPALAGCACKDAACHLMQKQLGAEESYIPQHRTKQWPWGPGSPSAPPAALLCICMLQQSVQLSQHLFLQVWICSGVAPSSLSSFLSTPQVLAGLFTKRSHLLISG